MNTEPALRRLARAVDLDADGLLTWLGRPLLWPDPDQSRITNPASGRAAVVWLRTFLYDRFYCPGQPKPLASMRTPTWTSPSLGGAFAWLASDRTVWEDYWQPIIVGDQKMLVKRDGLAAWCPRTRTRPSPHGVAVLMPIGRPALTPGFYYYSLQTRPQDDPGVRLYWSLTAGGAVEFVTRALAMLDGAEINMKVLLDSAAYWRADACVMYMSSATFRTARPRLYDLHAAESQALKDTIPAMTRRLGIGFALAKSPADGSSFGQQVCAVLAGALADIVHQSARNVDQRHAVLCTAMRGAGLTIHSAGTGDSSRYTPSAREPG